MLPLRYNYSRYFWVRVLKLRKSERKEPHITIFIQSLIDPPVVMLFHAFMIYHHKYIIKTSAYDIFKINILVFSIFNSWKFGGGGREWILQAFSFLLKSDLSHPYNHVCHRDCQCYVLTSTAVIKRVALEGKLNTQMHVMILYPEKGELQGESNKR